MQASTFASDRLSAVFAALADPTRRAILARLARGETRVGELVRPFPISGPAISRHLRVLENARLIERKIDAQWRVCRLNPPGLRVADDWLTGYREFWDQSLDRLVEALEGEQAQSDAAPPPKAAPPSGAARQAARKPGSRRTSSAPPITPVSRKRRLP